MIKVFTSRAAPIGQFLSGLGLALGLVFASPANAAPSCEFGQGQDCASSADCASNEVATLCASATGSETTCQVPCDDGKGNAAPSLCSLGETCVAGVEPGLGGGDTFFCKASKFSMDLNLMDACVYHFIEGLAPDLSGSNECSLVSNLSKMLDQDGNSAFNILDVDKCISAFLGETECDVATQSCPDDQIYCTSDAACGAGLHCDTDLHKCTRECGIIVSRESQSLAETIDRRCAGSMKTCDYDTGTCVDVEASQTACQVEADCPSGAFCFLGQCAPRCYRSLDCPGADWYCSAANECLPKPKADDGTSKPFNPKNYSVQFAASEVSLDLLKSEYDVPILLLDLVSRKQVVSQPNAVFGYRLEISDYKKMDDVCRGDIGLLPTSQQNDCIISADEQFFRLGSPFGTIYGDGDPSMLVGIHRPIADKLSPGIYQATLRAFFSNGNSTSVTLRFKKPSPSGEYVGRLSVYAGGVNNLLANTNVAMRLFVDKNAAQKSWKTVLAENNLDADQDLVDLTEGYPVRGNLHANSSTLFDLPTAGSDKQNEIPVVGIYSPQLGRMRLIGLVDYASDFCVDENAKKCDSKTTGTVVKNAFGRKVRRIVEFIGPFHEETRRFEGIYREKFSGLVPDRDVTLDGGFRLDQTVQDETAVKGTAIRPLSADKTVTFPALTALYSEVDKAVTSACSYSAEALEVADAVKSASAFAEYLGTFDTEGPFLKDTTSFSNLIENALNSLSTKNSARANLTVDSFLEGQVLPCTSSQTTNCTNTKALKCGLAAYRKALVRGYIDPSKVTGAGNTLFCENGGIPGKTALCSKKATSAKELVVLQDHNRLYKELTQTFTYQAGARVRDAFFALYKAANGEPLGESTAYAFKDLKLQEALSSFEEVRGQVFSNSSSGVLFRWPMAKFDTRGAVWLKQIQSMINDRMDTILEQVDLRRRVLKSAAQKDFLFAKHLLYQEYLQQVFLLSLQQQWEGSTFQYTGTGPDLFEKADQLLAKTNDTRNPLGLHPNRIYFENSDLATSNWQNFRNRLVNEMATLKSEVDIAVNDMKGALRDRYAFEDSLLVQQQQTDAALIELCGEPEALPAHCTASQAEKRTFCFDSDGDPSCPYSYECADETCSNVLGGLNKAFEGNIALSKGAEAACRPDGKALQITAFGNTRSCVNGRVGALLQERTSLSIQKTQTFKQFNTLMRRISRQQGYLADSMSRNEGLLDYIRESSAEQASLEADMASANMIFEMVDFGAGALECMIIVGMAGGTDCPQKIAASMIRTEAALIRGAVTSQIAAAQSRLGTVRELTMTEDSQQRQITGMRMELDNMATEVENLISSYEALTQQIFNIDQQIDDTVYSAQKTADRYQQSVGQVVDHLVGVESGSVLQSNNKVAAANARFQRMLIDAYKMTRAFVHRYNLSAQAEAWSNKVYQIVTIRDLEEFIAFLDGVERNYCGAEGLDCDYINNGEVFEFSVQKQLFPGLRDIVNPNTGAVLTVGQQFHNIITSSSFIQRRARAYGLSSQIEIPFSIWLNDRGENGGSPQRYMVGPGDCNHILRGNKGGAGGTVAVNVIGTRIPKSPGVKFELWRGNTDYIRSCTEKTDKGESKINPYIIGWTPSSALGQLDNPPSFFTQSGELSACINNHLLGDPASVDSQDGCFRFFARDRSLAAPDYSLVLPQLDKDQEWLLGDGLAENEKPIIEDIVLYFRYNDRPITAN